MPRTIVSIDPDADDSLTMRLTKAPQDIPDARRPARFSCMPDTMPDWDSAAAVKSHGKTLMDELNKHAGVQEALAAALRSPPGVTQPVYFHLNEDRAERLCWETLYSDQAKFLGLDARWPIGRIADSVIDRPVPPQNFSPPLRITAVLSALGREARRQWRGLRDAVVDARANGLPVTLQIFVGESALLDSIKAEIAAGLADVEIEPVPDRSAALNRALNQFRPHILHFFCHGTATMGVPRLEIATLLDEIDGKETGSLKIGVDQLQNFEALDSVWLLVLNCCDSGRAEENTHSMAHKLVANTVLAAIGTLEPFDVTDADELCAGFYPTLLSNFGDLVKSANTDQLIEMEWVTALRDARMGLSEKHSSDPENHRQWALPVLYTRPEPCFLNINTTAAHTPQALQEWKQRADVVAGLLAALPPETDDDVRLSMLSILDDAPDWLKPDKFGNFEREDVAADADVQPAPPRVAREESP